MRRTNKKLAKLYKLTTLPIATYSMGAWDAIGVFEINYDINDKVKAAWINSSERSRYHWYKIHYDCEGDAYIFMRGERRYLKDFM